MLGIRDGVDLLLRGEVRVFVVTPFRHIVKEFDVAIVDTTNLHTQ